MKFQVVEVSGIKEWKCGEAFSFSWEAFDYQTVLTQDYPALLFVVKVVR